MENENIESYMAEGINEVILNGKMLNKLTSLNPDKYKLITISTAVDGYRIYLNSFKDDEEYKPFAKWLLTEI